ncbi:MAG TPA: HepT-like ribonuclease domain-containing protein [Terriglobia bacterium]|nr:HepT-like ribonuclease domain-containing protein [Terriglobia bacterium]
MLDYAREAVEMARGRNCCDLDTDRQLSLALVRLLEVIGEAANRVPPEKRIAIPEVPWSQIVGLRNRLIHGYDEVDFDILWKIVTRDLPALIEVLEVAMR